MIGYKSQDKLVWEIEYQELTYFCKHWFLIVDHIQAGHSKKDKIHGLHYIGMMDSDKLYFDSPEISCVDRFVLLRLDL